jgi:hypothetical protein
MKSKLTPEERHARYVAYHQQYREARREQLAARARADYAAKKERLGKEALSALQRAWRKANPKKCRAYEDKRTNKAERAKAGIARSIKWAKDHPERIRESRKRYYARHREEVIARQMKHHWANRPAMLEKIWRNMLKRVYGLTPMDYDSLGGDCQICGVTKTIRGLLCGACNSGIADFKHDPTLLTKAIDYLNRTALQPAFIGT